MDHYERYMQHIAKSKYHYEKYVYHLENCWHYESAHMYPTQPIYAPPSAVSPAYAPPYVPMGKGESSCSSYSNKSPIGVTLKSDFT
jgi:hypothetical protein